MEGLTPSQKGAVAELAFAYHAFKLGFHDAVGAYCPEIDKCYLLPMSLAANRTQIYLRLSPAKNRQRLGIHLAAQYELGAIAQLGERQSGTLEAAGSSPASST